MSKSYDYRADMLATHNPKPKPVKGMTMEAIKLRALRRAMILREIASLDRLVTEAATVTGLTPVTIYKTAKRHGFRFMRYGDRDTPLEAAVREAYKPGGIGPTRMAERLGKSPKTLMVLACRLGLADSHGDPHRFRRGFEVPADRRAEYRELTRATHCTPIEAANHLRLIPRPIVAIQGDPRYDRTRPEARHT